jgi:hypothetical protein
MALGVFAFAADVYELRRLLPLQGLLDLVRLDVLVALGLPAEQLEHPFSSLQAPAQIA